MLGLRARLLVAFVPLLGCSTLVGPTEVSQSPYATVELVAYRALTRADFKSSVTRQPDAYAASHPAAQSCLRLVMRPSELQAHEIVTNEGRHFEALLARPLFFAAFDRNCSAWNAASTRSEEDILEHEQTHFGLEELVARRLNARADSIAKSVYKRGDDLQSVRSEATTELNRVLREANEECAAVQRRFDAQVFEGMREQQRRWYQKVATELEATTLLARGPQVLWQAASTHAAAPPAAAPTAVPASAETPAPLSPSPAPAPSPPSTSPPSVPTQGFSVD